LVTSFQNCELKQEPAHLQPSYNKLTNSTITEKQEASTLATELQRTHEFHGHGKNIYSAAPEMWGRNCSEIVTSGGTFVLTLNRASALKVEGSEQNFLLPLHIVANTEVSV
jgi:hypothetical protein